jgi:hypothetical protein
MCRVRLPRGASALEEHSSHSGCEFATELILGFRPTECGEGMGVPTARMAPRSVGHWGWWRVEGYFTLRAMLGPELPRSNTSACPVASSQLAPPDLENLFVVWVGDNLPACSTEDYRVAGQLASSGQVLIGAGDQEWLTPSPARVGAFDHEPTAVLAELAASRLPQQLTENLGVPVAHGPQRLATFAVAEPRLMITTHGLTVWVGG